MKEFVKSSVKVLVDYLLALLVFVIFIYVYISASGSHYDTYLPIYCLALFLLAFLIIYSDMKKLAEKEKRPQYDLHPHPLKGFLYGLAGFLPVIVLEVVSAFVVFPAAYAERIKHLFINTLMGPPYFIIRLAGEAPWGYALASLTVPLIAMLGYIAGYYGFELRKKKKLQEAEAANTFKKSPWNPSNNASGKGGAVKKKKTGTGNTKSGGTAGKKPGGSQTQKPL